MVNIKSAIDYIKEHGNDIEKTRMKCILLGTPASEDFLSTLSEMQNPDGGFSYWIKDFSTVSDTVYILSWLDDFSIRSGNLIQNAFEFLISKQQPDGSWDEVDELKDLEDSSFLIPGEINTRVFLTAYCTHWFVRFDRAKELEKKALPLEFIKEYRNPNGLILDDLQTTWDSLVLFSYNPGPGSELFMETIEIIEKRFSPENLKGSNLAYLLCCLRDAGLHAYHPLVNLCTDALIQKQEPDGNWDSEYGDEYTTSATIDALRVLKHYKVV